MIPCLGFFEQPELLLKSLEFLVFLFHLVVHAVVVTSESVYGVIHTLRGQHLFLDFVFFHIECGAQVIDEVILLAELICVDL